MKNLTLCGLFILFIASCQHDPYANNYLTNEPRAEDVVGIYQFKNQTVEQHIDSFSLKKSHSIIIINSDMTYELKEVPYFRNEGFMTYKYQKDISEKGSWSIETLGSISNGSDETKNHWGIKLESAPDELKYAGLTGGEKADGIIFGYGDPDAGAVMVFKKKFKITPQLLGSDK